MSVDIHHSVVHLIDTAQSQIEIGMVISWAGMGFILHFLLKAYGLNENERNSIKLKKIPLFLSFFMFLISYIIGYYHGLFVGGYYFEMVTGMLASDNCNCQNTEKIITNSSEHFMSDYSNLLQNLGIFQVLFVIIGAVFALISVVGNNNRRLRRENDVQESD